MLPATAEQLDATAPRLKEGRAFFYHLAEGVDPVLRDEFRFLDRHNCVRDGLVGIHSTALTDADFRRWQRRGGGSIVWSPFSNLWLYGDTTDVLSARRRGLRVCLGSDWTPSGTRNLLGELKVAARWNRIALDGALEPRRPRRARDREPRRHARRAVGRAGRTAGRRRASPTSRASPPCARTRGGRCSRRPSGTCDW